MYPKVNEMYCYTEANVYFYSVVVLFNCQNKNISTLDNTRIADFLTYNYIWSVPIWSICWKFVDDNYSDVYQCTTICFSVYDYVLYLYKLI